MATVDVTKNDQPEVVRRAKAESQWTLVFNRLKKNKIATVAFYYILLNIIIAFINPLLFYDSPISDAPGHNSRYGGGNNAFPNLKYPAGVDSVGYDTFSRALAGTYTSIMVGVFSTVVSLLIGVLVGLAAGYYQGKLEEGLMRITDLFLSVPFLVIALIILKLISSGVVTSIKNLPYVWMITILIGVFGWAGLARLVTANVKQVSSLEYVDAIRIMGARDLRIIFVHILPNVLSPIIVIGALFIAGGILSEAGLAFLGFSDPINTLSWGTMVSVAQDRFTLNPEQALVPGFSIFFLVLAVNLYSDALRDALDPRLRD